ncbi:MAG: hypothetical protein ACYSTN_07545, partial [Planctomycetota bacterium]
MWDKMLRILLIFVGFSFFATTCFGWFSRPSISFFPHETSNTMQQYDINEPCFKTMAVCNVSDGEYRYGEGPNGEDISVR